MRILNIGLDNTVLDKASPLAKRVVEYGGLVEKYTVIVPAKENKVVRILENTHVYGVKAVNKINGLMAIYYLAKSLIKKEKFDCLTVQDQYYLGLVGLKLARKFKLGLEIQVHGFEKYGGLRKLIAKYILPRANSIRVVSKRLKKRMVDEFGVKEARISVVPVHIKIKNQEPEDRSHGKDSNKKFVFLTVGRLVPVKNIEMQIDVMGEIIKKFSNTELWIIGEGELSQKLKAEIQNLGVGDNIKFLGWKDDVSKFYKQADVFMLTSYSEGWPLVILEAANYGLPIIMTDVGSAGDLIINNESGIVIPINNKEKLKEAMLNLIDDSDLKKKLGQGAKRAVNNLPTRERTLEMYKKSWELAAKK